MYKIWKWKEQEWRFYQTLDAALADYELLDILRKIRFQ